jgi:hypothetical protein
MTGTTEKESEKERRKPAAVGGAAAAGGAEREKKEPSFAHFPSSLLPKASHLPADELDLELFQLLVCDSVFGERERERERE